MQLLLIAALLGTTVLTAVRSTWSPCGRSMLSTITPVGERGRGARYSTSVAWFLTGALAGGACLGGAMAGWAAAVSVLLGPGPGVVPARIAAAVVAAGGLLAVTSDARVGGFRLPFHRRQVNELWLDRFRPWVYGAGFGWQIGVGFATYVMTAGLYLMVVLAILSASPLLAFGAGVSFGAVRGLAVLLGRHLTDAARLRRFHRRFDEAEPAVQRVTLWWEAALVAAGVAALWPATVGEAAVVVAVAATAIAVCGVAVAVRAGRPARL